MSKPQLLTDAEAAAIDARVAAVEARTGIELVAMVAERASHYPQIPWKAFALGSTMAGAAVVLADLLRPDWAGATSVLVAVLALLGAGAAAAVATVTVPAIAGVFLRVQRRDFETRRYAELMFRRRGVDATRGRTGVLVVVCRFERRIELVADRAFDTRIAQRDWDELLRALPTTGSRPAAVLLEALAAIEALLVARGYAATGPDANELPDRPREERG